jgi:hypothetical protein
MTVLEQFGSFSNFKVADDSGCGIITAADAAYFPGAQILSASCLGKAPLAIFDAGMTEKQRAWCERRARVLDLPELIMPRSEKMWQTWNKPRLIRASPYRTTLWLDGDCIVVGDLNPLFERARSGPFGVKYPYTAYLCRNKEDLYRRFPVPIRIPEERSVNGGVLGFGTDKESQELLETWEAMVGEAARDSELRGLISDYDQGALHWAVQARQSTDLMVTHRGWNRFIWIPGRGGPEHFIQQLKLRPDDVVLHAVVRPKPWAVWGDLDALPE